MFYLYSYYHDFRSLFFLLLTQFITPQHLTPNYKFFHYYKKKKKKSHETPFPPKATAMLTAVIRSSLGKHEMAFRARSLALRRGYRMARFERTCSLVSFHNTAVHTRPCQYLAFFGPSERSRLTFFVSFLYVNDQQFIYIFHFIFKIFNNQWYFYLLLSI